MKINEKLRPVLKTADIELLGADDTQLKVYGQFDCDLGILKRKETVFTTVVVEISGDGLIGMDFIQYFDCKIYASALSLVCQDEQIRCYNSETVGIHNINANTHHRLVTHQPTLVPPNSKSVLFVNQKHRVGYTGKWALAEPTQSAQDDELYVSGCLIGRVLVDTELSKIPLPVINVSDEPVLIPAGHTIGIISPINVFLSDMVDSNDPLNEIKHHDVHATSRLNGCSTSECAIPERSNNNEIGSYVKSMGLGSQGDLVIPVGLRSKGDLGIPGCGPGSVHTEISRSMGLGSQGDPVIPVGLESLNDSVIPMVGLESKNDSVRPVRGANGYHDVIGYPEESKLVDLSHEKIDLQDGKQESVYNARNVNKLWEISGRSSKPSLSSNHKYGDDITNEVMCTRVDKKGTGMEIYGNQNDPNGMELEEALESMIKRNTSHLNENQLVIVRKLVCKYKSLFSWNNTDIGKAVGIKHTIDTGNSPPLSQPMRRIPIHQQEEVDTQVKQMLEMGVIEPSMSPWNCPVVLVEKRDGSKRFCIDFRRINAVTAPGHTGYIQRIDVQLDSLQGSKWFSTLDVTSAYWNIEMDDDSKEKTAFSTRLGHWHFRRLPFGLIGSGYTYTRFMQHVMVGLEFYACLVYLDDVICIGRNLDEALINLENVLERLYKAGVKLKPKKCSLFQKETNFLGYHVSEEGFGTSPEKIEAIKSWPRPENVSDVRSFLGLVNYYKNFVHSLGDKAAPLYDFMSKDKIFKWTDEAESSFNELKRCLMSAPILAYPNMHGRFILDTDCSGFAMGGILAQIQSEKERVIGYASQALNKAEKQYCVTRRELLAVVTFVKKFRHYLSGKRFTVRTNHSSLQWLMNFKEPEGQVARWIEYLSAFDFEIIHRPGKEHSAADALSRKPCKFCDRYGLTDAHCNRIAEADISINKYQ
jgi:hypothetical protein